MAAKKLTGLIRSGEINFISNGSILDVNVKNYGKYGSKIIEHLIGQCNSTVTVAGTGLESYLLRKEGLCEMTDFLLGMWIVGKHNNLFHVNADIERLNKNYFVPKKQEIVNFAGTGKIDVKKWLPKMSVFEKDWNFALCSAFGGWIGYSGYEWPINEVGFGYEVATHAKTFVIGTQEQLDRYFSYRDLISDVYLKKDMESILVAFGRVVP